MKRLISLAVWTVALPLSAQSVEQFPYDAEVVVRRSLSVRSGPSLRHYRTGLLKSGAIVRVVGENGDWLAIAPPQGSFSWVNGDFIRELSPNEGYVLGDDVNVRVGTPVSEQLMDTVQIQLRRGDRVQLLQRRDLGSEEISQVWYKIVPPEGEVRWVHAEFVHPVGSSKLTARSKLVRQAGATDTDSLLPRELESSDNPESPLPVSLPDLPSPHSADQWRNSPGSRTNIPEFEDVRPVPNTQPESLYFGLIEYEIDKQLRLAAQRRDFRQAKRLVQVARENLPSSSARKLEQLRRKIDRQENSSRLTEQVGVERVSGGGRVNRFLPKKPTSFQSQSSGFNASGKLIRIRSGYRYSYRLMSPDGRRTRYRVFAEDATELDPYLGETVAIRGEPARPDGNPIPRIIVNEIVRIRLRR